MKKARKLYESSSGDRWYLIRDPSGALSSATKPMSLPEGRWNMKISRFSWGGAQAGTAGAVASDRHPRRGAPRKRVTRFTKAAARRVLSRIDGRHAQGPQLAQASVDRMDQAAPAIQQDGQRRG